MGLDQYAFVKKPNAEPEVLITWRKHNRLQGWMENLYYAKGGEKEEFNCAEVRITLNDLKALEQDIKAKSLPETSGFFFGNDSYEDYEKWYKKDDLKFIKKAKAELKKGNEIYYNSWW